MNKNNIIFCLMLLCLTSCDIATNFLVDGNHEKRITSECGDIILKGNTMAADYIELSFHGDFTVNLDSIKVMKNGSAVSRSEIRFSLNKNELKESCFHTIKGKDRLHIVIRQYPPLNYGHKGNIVILPSNFILCNKKAIITNKISFECKP